MKVLIVDDSALMRTILHETLASAEGISIVGEANTGRAAVELNEKLSPDVITMDYQMPIMDGVKAIRAIMHTYPTPVILFSNVVDDELRQQAMNAGAAAVLSKPDIDSCGEPGYLDMLISTMRNAVDRFAWAKKTLSSMHAEAAPAQKQNTHENGKKPVAAVVIGASTGGPAAVKEILDSLPADFPAGIALVQHIEDRFVKGYASWLNETSPLNVRLAAEGDHFVPGQVLVAPSNRHLICRGSTLHLDDGPKDDNHKPAVNQLFSTAAASYGRRLIGVLLTGMGADGARGCADIIRHGGKTLVQDEKSSFIFGMPKAAIEMKAASRILPLSKMSAVLQEEVRKHE